MATQHSRSAARLMMAPAVILLLGWMLVPLIMTLFFSFKKYLPLRGDSMANGLDWVGFDNYVRVRQFQFFLAQHSGHVDHCRWCVGYHHHFGCPSGNPSGSAHVGPRHCPHSCDRAVFCHADRVCAGLEEHVHGPG